MAILCEGLKANKSVTAIDLPDNNISVRAAGSLLHPASAERAGTATRQERIGRLRRADGCSAVLP